jgi:hypothetical protein
VAKLFLPQNVLAEWLGEQADVRDGQLLVKGEPGPYPVSQAVHFKALVSGDDTQKLVTKVKTQEQLQALGAEQMMESVLLGDTAYEVEPGYLVSVPDEAAAPKSQTDADLLAAFFLNKS